jgi:hypothetical protein
VAKNLRFKLRLSDRSGFQYLERELVKDKGSRVGPDEFDDPPPSKISLGGEGDISRGDYFRSSTSTAIDLDKTNPTFFITAAGGITPSFSHPYMRVTGSNSAITITANPRISAGREGQVLTLFCTDSNITLNNGQGISLMGSRNLLLQSGGVAVFMFNTANNVWNETSRVSSDVGIGG